MAPNYFVFLLIFCVTSCYSYGDNYGVKGGRQQQQGIKTYGGYAGGQGQGQGSNEYVHSERYHQQVQQQQQQPSYYQPYGWNHNQPTRTYGGVIPQNYPQGFGWAGNQFGNQIPNNNNNNPASFPKSPSQAPSLFLPNFVPPVYFPNTFPYPNYNAFPFVPPFNGYPSNAGPNGGNNNPNVGPINPQNSNPANPSQPGSVGQGGHPQNPNNVGERPDQGEQPHESNPVLPKSPENIPNVEDGKRPQQPENPQHPQNPQQNPQYPQHPQHPHHQQHPQNPQQQPKYPQQQPQYPPQDPQNPQQQPQYPQQPQNPQNPQQQPQYPQQPQNPQNPQQQPQYPPQDPQNPQQQPQYPQQQPQHPQHQPQQPEQQPKNPDNSPNSSTLPASDQKPQPGQNLQPGSGYQPGQRPEQGQGPQHEKPPQQEQGPQPGQYPMYIPPRPVQEPNLESHNQQAEDDNGFASNAFFDAKEQSKRQWTQEDEQKYQATTKAPYFENKAPGLECTLPASAVLGATSALKASSWLPLHVPIGKPILSCNATELLQAQISLNGIIYDCNRHAITMSCPRIDANNVEVDDCQGESLECDVKMKLNSQSVSCTNGTLISNHPIVCKSATLMEHKNVLNCFYKTSTDVEKPVTSRFPRPPAVVPLPTQRPRPATPQVSYVAPAPVTQNPLTFDTLDVRQSFDRNNRPQQPLDLEGEVKRALQYVFPHELLSFYQPRIHLTPPYENNVQARIYLPPVSPMGHIPYDLRQHMQGIFPFDLFAMSHQVDLNSLEELTDYQPGSGLSQIRGGNANTQNQASFTQQRQSQWDTNVNRKASPGSSVKTAPSRLSQRLGSEPHDDGTRHIFTP